MKISNFSKLVTSILVSEFAGFIGSVFAIPAISTWYATLAKPALNPPAWIFAPVWTTLYFLMGVAAFFVWRRRPEGKDVKAALSVFGVQLALNALWSVVFFGLHSPFWALIDIALLWLAIVWTMYVFYKISPLATYLLIPYILWVSFALYLNYAVFVLN